MRARRFRVRGAQLGGRPSGIHVSSTISVLVPVGAIREALARVDGEIVDTSLVTLTLSCDHRILYGADAAGFLAEIRALLQTPLRILL